MTSVGNQHGTGFTSAQIKNCVERHIGAIARATGKLGHREPPVEAPPACLAGAPQPVAELIGSSSQTCVVRLNVAASEVDRTSEGNACYAVRVWVGAMADPARHEIMRKEFEEDATFPESHPAILPCYGCLCVEVPSADGLGRVTTFMVVLEHMNQGSLEDIIKCKGAIDTEAVAWIARQISAGLAFLHAPSRRIIHHDVKPSNVLVNTNGDVKLCDFWLRSRLASPYTGTSSFLGTKCYFSPERLSGEDYHDKQTDVWSMGVTIAECLNGRFPYYAAPEWPAKAAQDQHFQFVHHFVISGMKPPLPPDLQDTPAYKFVTQCCDEIPSERPLAKTLESHDFIRDATRNKLTTWLAPNPPLASAAVSAPSPVSTPAAVSAPSPVSIPAAVSAPSPVSTQALSCN